MIRSSSILERRRGLRLGLGWRGVFVEAHIGLAAHAEPTLSLQVLLHDLLDLLLGRMPVITCVPRVAPTR